MKAAASEAGWFRAPFLLLVLACAGASGQEAPGPGGSPASSSPSQFSELVTRSAALTPEQKAKAQQSFSAGFLLWQSGEFAAAAIGFRQGLEMDPANVQANYYLGDCLQRTRQRKEAAQFYMRASVLGTGSVEGLKASAALQVLSKPPSIEEMSPEELKAIYVGTWNLRIECSWGIGNYKLIIRSMPGDAIAASKTRWDSGEGTGRVHEGQITLSYKNLQYEGHIVDATTIKGSVVEPGATCNWTAMK